MKKLSFVGFVVALYLYTVARSDHFHGCKLLAIRRGRLLLDNILKRKL